MGRKREMPVFEINYYTLPDGKKPAKEFIDSLPNKMKVKAFYELEILEQMGNQLREPFSKYMEDGIFELRIKFASDITRIFYFFVVDEQIILTNGFLKKSQKTPKRELELAKKYKLDYERRYSHE